MSCAIGHFAGISPLLVQFSAPVAYAGRRLTTVGSSTQVSYVLALQVEAYGFASAFAAYNSVKDSLASAVTGGAFTRLINDMADRGIFSPEYRSPVLSNKITFSPFQFPSNAPAAQAAGAPSTRPSSASVPIDQLNLNPKSQASSPMDFSTWIIIAVVVLVAILVGMYAYRRYWNFEKIKALKDIDGLHMGSEVIPEDGDPIEWSSTFNNFPTPHQGVMAPRDRGIAIF